MYTFNAADWTAVRLYEQCAYPVSTGMEQNGGPRCQLHHRHLPNRDF